jgi:hypothetical protein
MAGAFTSTHAHMSMWSCVVAVASVSAGCAGCEGCGEEPRPKPPAAAVVGDFELVDPPEAARALALFSGAAAGLAVGQSDGVAAGATLAWRMPSCVLGYQLRSLTTSDVAPGRPPMGVEAMVDLTATVDGAGEDVSLLFALMGGTQAMLHDDARTAKPFETKGWVAPRVVTDGQRWQERGGPSTLWAAHGALPPLALAFPRLPRSAELGASTTWVVQSYPPAVTAKADALRLEGAAGLADPGAPYRTLRIKLEFEGWQQIGAENVGVMVGRWGSKDERFDPIHSRKVERWVARFVVTARGRLLHAALVANRWHWAAVAAGQVSEKVGVAELEVRLTEACDGVTLPRMTGTPAGAFVDK